MGLSSEDFNRLALDSFNPDASDEPNLRQILVQGFLVLSNQLEQVASNQLLDGEILPSKFSTLQPSCTDAAVDFITAINAIQDAVRKQDQKEQDQKEIKIQSFIDDSDVLKAVCRGSLFGESIKASINQELAVLQDTLNNNSLPTHTKFLEIEEFRIKTLRLLLSNACQGTPQSSELTAN